MLILKYLICWYMLSITGSYFIDVIDDPCSTHVLIRCSVVYSFITVFVMYTSIVVNLMNLFMVLYIYFMAQSDIRIYIQGVKNKITK